MAQSNAMRSPSIGSYRVEAWTLWHRNTDKNVVPHHWGWFAARGSLLVALGITALLLPGPSLFGFGMVFAGFCFANGVITMMSGVRAAHDKTVPSVPLLLSGLAGIIVGTLFVLFPILSTLAYALTAAMVLAAWAVMTGVLEVSAAVKLRQQIKGEWLLGLSGTLSILLGLAVAFLAFMRPGTTVLSAAWLIGAYALASGATLLVLGLRLRKLREHPWHAPSHTRRNAT